MNATMETICTICINVRNKTKMGISFQKLVAVIRKEFRLRNIDIDIRTSCQRSLDQEEFYVNAYYDADNDCNNDTAIEVIIYHNFNKQTSWDYSHITDLLVQVFDAIVHEYKHRRQSIKRNYKTYWLHSEYLSDPDEIDAYSLSIAIELCRTLGKNRSILYMHKLSKLSRLKINNKLVSPNLFTYVKVYKTLNHPCLAQLAKKIYKRLLKIDTDAIFM